MTITDAADHLDLAYDDDQAQLAAAIGAWAGRECADDVVRAAAGTMPWGLWRSLAGLGVLGLATPEGGGGALEIAASMEALGHAVTPGPLAATFMASQLVDAGTRRRLAAGEVVASIGEPPLMPWAQVASVFVELAGDVAWAAEPVSEVVPVDTLGGEPWGRVELRRGRPLGDAGRAVAIGDVAVAAYLVGAGGRLVTTTAEWARDRRQFGRAIGDFQSVAHPLTDVAVRLRAATNLVRRAAFAVDAAAARRSETVDAAVLAATARLSATRGALDASHRAHQAFGALGYTVEGPVHHVAARIRQLSLHPPGPDAARAVVLRRLRLGSRNRGTP